MPERTAVVVVTGAGLCSPLGRTLDDARAVFAGGRSVVRIAPNSTEKRLRVAAFLDEDLAAGLSPGLVKTADRMALMALHASDRAMADAGLAGGAFDPWRAGTFIGTGSGSIDSIYHATASLIAKDTMPALTLLKVLPNGAASLVSMRHGLKGECSTMSVACASAAHAFGTALRLIRHGYLDLALVGGTEAPLVDSSFRAWEALRVLAHADPQDPSRTCRPFALGRGGVVLGEGAAMYVLESAAHARARGARVHATLAGFGSAADASHLTLSQSDGQVAAMRAALADAGLAPADIGYINAQGTGTPHGDETETRSVHEVFGARAAQTPISGTKSFHGHLLGASGAIELAAALIALRDGLLPPTLHLDAPDPACDLDYIPHQARQVAPPRAVMKNSFAFGGSNASLILTR